MNGLQIFQNKQFGEVRTVIINNEIWFVGKDITTALGYQNASKALQDHVDTEDKLNNISLSSLGQRGGWLINESGLYSLILSSKLPTAKDFKRWVTSEVLPTLRKTGSYNINHTNNDEILIKKQIAEATLLNAQNARAELWLKLGDRTTISEYKQITDSYAANTLAGKVVFELPERTQQTYSATEIGQKLGISANKVGKLANANNLKTEQYGKFFYDKSRFSNKEVETFRYYDTVVPQLQKLI